ncbi:hypothetical protein IWX90DRAFT_724 [Phyllosticta citrichinensis]|uniref:Uncharacterized protein n=1 Tax=Phyllosticta citrichinensis TaxID=1130410 RepID=A0ABR1Y4V1_9PEZI
MSSLHSPFLARLCMYTYCTHRPPADVACMHAFAVCHLPTLGWAAFVVGVLRCDAMRCADPSVGRSVGRAADTDTCKASKQDSCSRQTRAQDITARSNLRDCCVVLGERSMKTIIADVYLSTDVSMCRSGGQAGRQAGRWRIPCCELVMNGEREGLEKKENRQKGKQGRYNWRWRACEMAMCGVSACDGGDRQRLDPRVRVLYRTVHPCRYVKRKM